MDNDSNQVANGPNIRRRYCNRIPAGEQRIAKDGIEAVINPISTGNIILFARTPGSYRA